MKSVLRVFVAVVIALSLAVIGAGKVWAIEEIIVKESTTESSIRENLQNDLEVRREKMEAARAEFKTRLQIIRDEKKQVILQRLVTKFDTVNAKWANNWKEKLDQLVKVLDKMDLKSNQLAERGVDVSSYRMKATVARQKIAAAKALLDVQVIQLYTPPISTEVSLGTDVKEVTSQFRTDIKEAQSAVKVAREAVHTAFAELKTLKVETNEQE